MADDEFNLDNRILCSDGACIGVVGEDGKCKVCGLAYDGELPEASPTVGGELVESSPLPQDVQRDNEVDERASGESGQTGASNQVSLLDNDSEERICCSDDMCVGIVGQDGTCGTCGKAYPREGV